MRQRRSIAVVVFVLLAFSLVLQACASNKNNNKASESPSPTTSASASTSAPPSESASPAAELKPYEVSITYFGTPEADVALVEEKLSEYFKEKINATIKLQPIAASDYQNRTELMMNTGEKMDLVFTASWLNYFGNVTKGAFLELDELLDKYGQGIKDTIHPLYLEAPRMKGKLYAVPTNKEITQGQSFTYRKDIVEKYNIPIETINKWADLDLATGSMMSISRTSEDPERAMMVLNDLHTDPYVINLSLMVSKASTTRRSARTASSRSRIRATARRRCSGLSAARC